MAWNDLLARLRASTDVDVLRFADLLEMDLDGFSKSGNEGTTHGPKFGDHIPTGAQSHFELEIRRLIGRSPATAQDLVKDLANFFGDPTLESFKATCNDGNKCTPSSFRALRYVPLNTFLNYYLGQRPNLPAVGHRDRAIEAKKSLEKAIKRLEGSSRVSADLANPKWSGRVWTTRSDDTSPHEVALVRGLSEADTCNFVAQQMGLLGYADAPSRSEKIGMVGLEYIANIDMYRPTVLDALPFLNGGSQVLAFYPGPRGKDHGETLPLEVSLSASGTRAVPGVPEWIHAVQSVILRNLPRKDLKETWHCRVAWSGVW